MSATARASWVVPTAVLTLVAVHERLPRAAVSPMITAALASAGIGLVLAAIALLAMRRTADLPPAVQTHALVGALVSISILVVGVLADASGVAAMREAQRTLESTTTAALRDAPGWNGGATIGATNIAASSLDRRSQASKIMTHPFDGSLRVLLFFIDNRAGDHEVVVDLESVRVRLPGGVVRASIPRKDLLAQTTSAEDRARLAGVIRVPAGQHVDRAQAFFAEDVNFRDVEAVELLVDSAPRVIQGRYFTLAEKRAIDARAKNSLPATDR